MSLSDDLLRTRKNLCTVGKIIETLEGRDREALIASFQPKTKRAFLKIEQDLRKNGFRISLNTINLHYHHECKCYWGEK